MINAAFKILYDDTKKPERLGTCWRTYVHSFKLLAAQRGMTNEQFMGSENDPRIIDGGPCVKEPASADGTYQGFLTINSGERVSIGLGFTVRNYKAWFREGDLEFTAKSTYDVYMEKGLSVHSDVGFVGDDKEVSIIITNMSHRAQRISIGDCVAYISVSKPKHRLACVEDKDKR